MFYENKSGRTMGMDDLVAGIGKNIRTRRHQLGLTLSEVASSSGLSISYIGNLEKGRGNPTVGVLLVISKALRTTIQHLLKELK